MDIHPSYTWATLAKLYAKRFMLDLDRFHIRFSKSFKTINCSNSKEGNLPMSELNIQKEQTKLYLLREIFFRPRIVKGLGKEAIYFSKLALHKEQKEKTIIWTEYTYKKKTK